MNTEAVLRAACGHALWCARCSDILDYHRCVLVESSSGPTPRAAVVCVECFAGPVFRGCDKRPGITITRPIPQATNNQGE